MSGWENARELEDIRHDIDEIDAQILALFERRMGCSREVAEVKQACSLPVFAPRREEQLLQDRLAKLSDPALSDEADSFFRHLMMLSKQVQRKNAQQKKPLTAPQETRQGLVAYQGVSGANGEQAVRQFFGEEAGTLPCEQFGDVVEAVQCAQAEYGVLPIENALGGSVYDVYDLLGESDCYIIAEQNVNIDHCLLAIDGAVLGDIDHVYSHPQGLRQCARYLKHMPWQQHSYRNTAAAAEFVAHNGQKNCAAIASRRAAEWYQLNILRSDIQDRKDNVTRFVVIARQPCDVSGQGKISLAFSLLHESGSLHAVLSHFSARGLNLTKIESRNIPSRPFEYRFYMDFEGDVSREAVDIILGQLSGLTTSVQFLGAYYPGVSPEMSREEA